MINSMNRPIVAAAAQSAALGADSQFKTAKYGMDFAMKRVFLSVIISILTINMFYGQNPVLQSVPLIADCGIVYVEIDVLTENYLMTIDLTAELDEMANSLEVDFVNRQEKFQANVRDYQLRAERGLETRARLEIIYEQLVYEEEQLIELAESYREELEKAQAFMQNQILQAIMDYLKEYGKEKGYRYILGNTFDAHILYADPALDVTAEVLEGLNVWYRENNK